MSRPKPEIKLDKINPKNMVSLQICSCEGLYVVLYDGAPFCNRQFDHISNRGPHKYRRVGFSTSAHAKRMATRLNTLFNTDKFTTHEVNIPASKRID